ncbi:MAG: hypothetical protein FIB01_06675 [Gemmatimonadetes bacterium]|nr:hypothetical protein [Gemmatimonadota bacterium]
MSHEQCRACLEFLLSAEPEELRGGHAQREHLRTCESCSARARAIGAHAEELATALAAVTDGRSRTGAGRVPSRGGRYGAATAPARGGRWSEWLPALAGVAAAAALLIALGREEPRVPAARVPAVAAAPRVPATTVVNAAGPGGVAVMPTNNPDITIVWTF